VSLIIRPYPEYPELAGEIFLRVEWSQAILTPSTGFSEAIVIGLGSSWPSPSLHAKNNNEQDNTIAIANLLFTEHLIYLT
jgi:hypothetical protein